MLKRIMNEMSALGWTLGGTALVLITLSGETFRLAMIISGLSLLVHMAGVIWNHFDEENAE
jgi:hypothetical protein